MLTTHKLSCWGGTIGWIILVLGSSRLLPKWARQVFQNFSACSFGAIYKQLGITKQKCKTPGLLQILLPLVNVFQLTSCCCQSKVLQPSSRDDSFDHCILWLQYLWIIFCDQSPYFSRKCVSQQKQLKQSMHSKLTVGSMGAKYGIIIAIMDALMTWMDGRCCTERPNY